MSDVYNHGNLESAQQQFDELRQQLIVAIDPTTSKVVDEPDLYGVTNRQAECYGFVRIDEIN